MSQSAPLNLSLHERQGRAFTSKATEILYGGAAGGGKSHLMRVASVIWCAEIPGLQVYLFRRIREDLIKNHMEGANGYRSLLAPWVQAGLVKIVEDEIRFLWNGSKIYLCHCKDEKDRFKYQGSEIHVLLMDELTHFTEVIYRFLRNRVRMVGIDLKEEYKGIFPRIISGANPGGVGHQFVKTTFVDDVEPMEVRRMPPSEGGMLRQFIPARLEDNPSMARDDPDYEKRLEGLGSKALVDAMRWGDWNVVEGAYFDCWNAQTHVLRPFEIPKDWLRFRSFDWGSAKPFSVGWWAIANEQFRTPDGQIIPRGAMVRYREWYGKKSPDVGLKLTVEQVADGIKEREAGDKISYGVADTSIFAEDGGPSQAERFSAKKVFFKPADKQRLAGWSQMRDRMIGEDQPMIYCFSTCVDSIRTIPALQHDENKPEDLDTSSEDHAADEWRYACMSRPWVRTIEKPKVKDAWADVFEDEVEESWKTV
ncbi:terminase family protein [Sneathiella glossodoripedis]|uniref:terminase family protein n=1 Tax=Sneathiella glossodoripedis TaxID=418853 RepID=UPI0004729E15|nr:terminase family protein [Sneathiella glossodoripedis]